MSAGWIVVHTESDGSLYYTGAKCWVSDRADAFVYADEAEAIDEALAWTNARVEAAS